MVSQGRGTLAGRGLQAGTASDAPHIAPRPSCPCPEHQHPAWGPQHLQAIPRRVVAGSGGRGEPSGDLSLHPAFALPAHPAPPPGPWHQAGFPSMPT